ncbi:TPA: hypothetical protein ACSP88_004503 [Aeromonas hydrophila]
MNKIIKRNFEIHEYSGKDNFIKGLLYDYWDFTNFEEREYRYTQKELSDKYNIYYQDLIASLMLSQGHITINVLMGCQQCRQDVKIHKRIQLERLQTSRNQIGHQLFCSECFMRDTEREIDDAIEAVNNIVSVGRIEDKSTGRDELLYIEKLLLLVLLSDEDTNPEDIKEHVWSNFTQVEINRSHNILNGLIDKGYIVAHCYDDRIRSLVSKLNHITENNRLYISPDQENRIQYTISNINRAYINLPAEFRTFKEFENYLYNEVVTSSLSVSDLKQIVSYVIKKRQSEIISIFKKTCRDKKIQYKDDNALHMVLSSMVEKFNLQECNNIIEYRSKHVIHRMYVAKIKGLQHFQHYFRSDLMRYFDLLDSRSDIKRYEKPLDIDWVLSQTESFVSVNIFRDNVFWSKLTTSEIIAKWVAALGVQPG